MVKPGTEASGIATRKPQTHLLLTTVIGSWPKPLWLASPGWAGVDGNWRFRGEELRRKQSDATAWALREQEATGVDIVSDGEIRRANYVQYHCRHLDGFDFEHRVSKRMRAGVWVDLVPTITSPVVSRQVFLVTDYQFIRDRTDRRIKMTIPGPMTMIDSTKDEYYGDERALAIDLAAAIRVEVEALATAGCDIIQFDEPVFVRYPEKALDYGLSALEACFEGITTITTVVHICCGYPVDLKRWPKASPDNYALITSLLAGSKIDQISIEAAHQSLDLEVLHGFGSKDIILGLVDTGEPCIETVEAIENRIRQGLDYVKPERLCLAPDCGMLLLEPDVARAKLTHLVEAARRVREQL